MCSRPVLSILLDIYPEVGFGDHMVIIILIFQVTDVPLAVAAPFYIPASNAQMFQFLHSLDNTCCPLEFVLFVFIFTASYCGHAMVSHCGFTWPSWLLMLRIFSCACWLFLYLLFTCVFIFGFAGSSWVSRGYSLVSLCGLTAVASLVEAHRF